MGVPPVPSAPRDCLARVPWLSQLGEWRLQTDEQVTSCDSSRGALRRLGKVLALRLASCCRLPLSPLSWLDKEPQMLATAILMGSCGKGSH